MEIVIVIMLVGIIVAITVIKSNKKEIKEKENNERHYPVKMDAYKKVIILKRKTDEGIVEMIQEQIEVTDEPIKAEQYQVSMTYDGEWVKVACPDELSFYGFHNLIAWFDGCKVDQHSSEVIIGLAIHKSNDDQSYYALSDLKNECGDTVVGVMNSGKHFSVYLPESYEEEGNMMMTPNGLEHESVKAILESVGFDSIDL